MSFQATHFTQAPTLKGAGCLAVEVVAGQSAVTSLSSSNPTKLLAPRSRGQSVWAYTSSFGGGLVAGDETELNISLGEGARCFVGTQSSTKIYRNPALRPCSHATTATLDKNAVLIFAPDPVQAFAGSTYRQRQKFRLASGAGLVLLDWFTSGRAARGERWAFKRLQSRNEVWNAAGVAQTSQSAVPQVSEPARFAGAPSRADSEIGGTADWEVCAAEKTLVFMDSLLLDSSAPIASPHVAGRFNCFALLLMIGSPLRECAAGLLEQLSRRPVERRGEIVCSASAVSDGVLLRVASESVESVGREIHRYLQPVTKLLGDDPWARKW